MFFINRFFWGLVFVVIGVLLILRNVFGIDIPVWGVLWPILLILLGLSILLRPRWRWGKVSEHEVIMDEGSMKVSNAQDKYDTIFGHGMIDFSDIKAPEKGSRKLEVNSIFSGVEMKISEDTPMRIVGTGVFGGVEFPNGQSAAFGERTYTTKAFDSEKPYVYVKVSAVFGGVEIKY